MIRSLAARLTLLQQLTAVVVVLAFGLASLWITAEVLRAERRAYVAETANRLAREFDEELTELGTKAAASRSVIEEAAEAGVRVRIHDVGGALLATSRAARDSLPQGDAPGRPEVFRATAVSARGARVDVEAANPWLSASLGALTRSLLIAAVPILLIALLAMRLMVTRALRPLSTMADRAATLSLEHNPRSLGARSDLEELDRLSRSFDRLLVRLDDALQAERRLTADASHELRTPLMTIGGELEMALEKSPRGAAAGLQRAADQVGAMRDLVDALLLLHHSRETGRAGDDEFEVINLSDLVRETLAEIRLRHPDRSGDVAATLPDEVLIRGSTTLLTSAVRNLLENAIKFTSPGGRICAAVSRGPDAAFLTVDDQGPGIPAGERERVFDPFFRGAEARAGTGGFGLGLPILRRVARAHGGDVEVLDSPLGGVRFVLRVPAIGGAEDVDRSPGA